MIESLKLRRAESDIGEHVGDHVGDVVDAWYIGNESHRIACVLFSEDVQANPTIDAVEWIWKTKWKTAVWTILRRLGVDTSKVDGKRIDAIRPPLVLGKYQAMLGEA